MDFGIIDNVSKDFRIKLGSTVLILAWLSYLWDFEIFLLQLKGFAFEDIEDSVCAVTSDIINSILNT